MRDVVLVLLAIGFFALAVAYVRACAAIVGQGATEAPEPRDNRGVDESEVAA